MLDGSLHHTAMKKLKEYTRRGRPDIVHTFLLISLESVLNIDGSLKVLVHTRNNQLLRFDPEIRLPKNYNRFVGLIEQLFESGVVPKDALKTDQKPLIQLEENRTLPSVVEELRTEVSGSGRILQCVILSDFGRKVNPREHFRIAAESGEDVLCIIGGFPEGDYKTELSELSPADKISIHPTPLKSWTVASEVLVNFRTDNNRAGKNGSKPGGKVS
jgi:rRNA small subunit pseudouridine methyltransferase Nep1